MIARKLISSLFVLNYPHARVYVVALCTQLIIASLSASTDRPILSNIEIMEQYVDFSQLSDEEYRNTLPFGDRLLNAFDSVLSFTNCPNRLELPYDLNTLTLHFSLPEWRSPHMVQYTYLLEGRDHSWHEPSKQPYVTLRDLSAGTYTLRVKARNRSGNWSLQNSYDIVIRKPWWMTQWALAVMMLIVTGLMALYLRQWRQRNNEIREMQHLLDVYRTSSATSLSTGKVTDQGDGFLRLINKTLEEHLSDENFGIAELCEILNISRAQLHRKLKKQTGLSTSHYIRYLRLQMARDMFRDSNLNVSEVAFAVGFSNAAYFSKVFKAMYGISPSEARDQLQ